jgi:histidine triad (HIT) family protein
MEECIFCNIASGRLEAKKVWEDEKHLAFLDLEPISEGHLLLVPKKHSDYIFDLADDEYLNLFAVAKKIAGPLKQAMGAKRIGIIVEGFGVPHVHIHLVPINLGNELDPNRAHHVGEAQLNITAEAITKSLI